MTKGTETTLTPATTTSSSLRTTVPAWIISQFELQPGDALRWNLEVVKGSLRIEVEPVKK